LTLILQVRPKDLGLIFEHKSISMPRAKTQRRKETHGPILVRFRANIGFGAYGV
jgi:hypothetical protein